MSTLNFLEAEEKHTALKGSHEDQIKEIWFWGAVFTAFPIPMSNTAGRVRSCPYPSLGIHKNTKNHAYKRFG